MSFKALVVQKSLDSHGHVIQHCRLSFAERLRVLCFTRTPSGTKAGNHSRITISLFTVSVPTLSTNYFVSCSQLCEASTDIKLSVSLSWKYAYEALLKYSGVLQNSSLQ